MNDIIYVLRQETSSYGVNVILDHLRKVIGEEKVKFISHIDEASKEGIIIPYGILTAMRMIKTCPDRCIINLMVDSYSLSVYSEMVFFVRNRYFTLPYLCKTILRYLKYTYCEYKILKHFSNIMLVSIWDQNHFLSTWPFKRYAHKVFVVPNGVDIPPLVTIKNSSNNGGEIIIGCLSAWSDTIFFPFMIFLRDVWCKAIEVNPNMRLKVAGRGLSPKYIKKMSKYKNIEILGEIDSLDSFYDQIDACLITICKEAGMLNKVLEGFAYKRPVIGRPQNFLSFRNIPDCYYTYNDMDSFLKAISDISKNEDNCRKKVEDALDYIKRENDWNNNYMKLHIIIEETYSRKIKR